MAKHIWSVLCDRALVDKESGQVSLIGIVEKIKVNATIAELENIESGTEDAMLLPAHLALATWWVRSDYDTPETGCARIRLLSPEGNELINNPYPIRLENAQGWRPILSMRHFPFNRASGVYWFENQEEQTDGSWQTVARLPIQVAFSPEETGE